MLINRKQLIELFLSDVQDISPEYQSIVRKKLLSDLSKHSSIDLIIRAKKEWNWKLDIARSNTFLLEVGR